MRMMLRITIPVEAGNKGVQDGSLPRTIQTLIERIKPEASYFFPDNGLRSALFVFNMQEGAQIPASVEPLFLALNAGVTLTPVMNAEDLQKGLAEAGKLR
jgi:hypothetical protein